MRRHPNADQGSDGKAVRRREPRFRLVLSSKSSTYPPRPRALVIAMSGWLSPSKSATAQPSGSSDGTEYGNAPALPEEPRHKFTAAAVRISRPPIVGVPDLARCVCGPSCRITWPIWNSRSLRTIQGPSARLIASADRLAAAVRNVM